MGEKVTFRELSVIFLVSLEQYTQASDCFHERAERDPLIIFSLSSLDSQLFDVCLPR